MKTFVTGSTCYYETNAFLFLTIIVAFLSLKGAEVKSHECYDDVALVQLGNLGRTGKFPWLGLLRVHVHNRNKTVVAVSGLIMVKELHAIANANDLDKVSKDVLSHDASALFMLSETRVWSAKVINHMIHPEYHYATINTIALVHLETTEKDNVPLPPVCLPLDVNKKKLSSLYTIRYTDERRSIEKVFHRMKLYEQYKCKQHYRQNGLLKFNYWPTNPACATATGTSCAWDNAMALLSNDTGTWTLVGLGVKGFGCGAPSLYIDIKRYASWMETALSLNEPEIPENPDYL